MTKLLFLRKWLNAVGLTLGMAGVVFIFIWGPPQPSFEGNALLLESTNPTALAAQKAHHQCMSQIGLGLIGLGFLFQFINELLPKDLGHGGTQSFPSALARWRQERGQMARYFFMMPVLRPSSRLCFSYGNS